MAHKFTRRDFLKLGAAGAGALVIRGLTGLKGSIDPAYINTFIKVPVTSPPPVSNNLGAADFCQLSPIVMPKKPVYVPARAELDPATGLHMTGNVVYLELDSYRLKVTGRVDHPLVLTYDQLRCMPKVTSGVDIICKGNFEDFSTWGGVPISHVLDLAGVQPGAKAINFTAGDGYVNQASLDDSRSPDAFLAHEWLGSQALPILFGFPLRAVFPSKLGYYDVKWLLEMEVI